ncbi:MAG: hypothetical protein R2789_10165 [Microthrixaceae bacterium]
MGVDDQNLGVLIIGAGAADCGMVAQSSSQAGWSDFVVLEKSDGVGAPLAATTAIPTGCDALTPSTASPSLELRWSRKWAKRPRSEYFESLSSFRIRDRSVSGEGIGSDLVRGRKLLDRARPTTGPCVRRSCAMAGPAQRPTLHIVGLETFDPFHSARWNHDHDLAGERVG